MKNLPVRLLLAAFLALAPCVVQAAGMVVNPTVVSPGFDSTPEAAMQAARARVAAGDLSGALHQLSIYVAAHPDEYAPARLLGDLYYRQGNLSQAELIYAKILARSPADRETHNRLGAVYAAMNRIDDAIHEYNLSLPGADSVPELAELHMRKGDFAQYRTGLEREVQLYPGSAETEDQLGALHIFLHDNDGALRYIMRELDVMPESLKGLNRAGEAYMNLGLYDKAFDMLHHCLRVDSSNYSCMLNLAAANLETGDYATGKSLLDRAEKLAPEHPEILVNYGYLADRQGNWKEAITYYVKALAVSPYARDAYLNLGVDYEVHQLYELAESALLKGISVAPTDGALHYVLGRTYEDQNKHDLAIQQFQAAFNSTDPQAASLAKRRISQLSGGTTPSHPQ